MTLRTLVASALVLLLGTTTAVAQQQTGEIYGRAADNTGAVLPGTTVTVAATVSTETTQQCLAAGGTCTTCAGCGVQGSSSCVQPFYCATEALGATEASCAGGDDSMCPPGTGCLAIMGPGACFSLGNLQPCVLDSECPNLPDAGAGVCLSRMGPAITGYCQTY